MNKRTHFVFKVHLILIWKIIKQPILLWDGAFGSGAKRHYGPSLTFTSILPFDLNHCVTVELIGLQSRYSNRRPF